MRGSTKGKNELEQALRGEVLFARAAPALKEADIGVAM
ncbi:hypothetical protein MNV_1140020 [Candidatus Methanoperedens nitroreducens]|uniref:Uncharacterized protein n=1 Tax=Candidatus Methanoperedens nitratireducens TaxID=1392998 RepID=A0A284VJ67_9EURY|nr:hypothetical protein MNV_1140020 [Candidatus Methanoperedens nitroreducens]